MPSMRITSGLQEWPVSFPYLNMDIQISAGDRCPFKYHVAPVNFYWFSDGLYAEGADKNYATIVGAKLVKVEGMPVNRCMEAIKPLVPAENDQYFKAYGLDFTW